VLLWVLSYVYVAFGHVPWIAAIFYGLKPAVTAIVATAVIRIGRKSLKSWVMWVIAGAAFVGIYFYKVPFPLIIATAAVAGWLGALKRVPPTVEQPESKIRHGDGATWRRAVTVTAICVGLWMAPIVAAGLSQGWSGTLVREGLFFSKAAMVTFGGAYAVLPYVGQQAVENYGWLTAPQMLDGLGLAETTPGPLIMVVQFVGFLGGWNHPGALSPLVAATLGAAITTWTTFVPCFLWIFLGAPHLEKLRRVARISAALAAVTAAVVGVVLNLAVWFGWQTFRPEGVIDWFAVVVAAIAFVALQWVKASVVTVILVSGALGLIWSW
jgi:chromate transporter